MGPSDLDQNPTLKYDFSGKSSEELGLVENPTETQLEEIIQKKVTRKRKPKGKTVYFRDFIKEIPDSESDLAIIEEPIRLRTDIFI